MFVQCVIPLHRFSEEVSNGVFKDRNKIEFARTQFMRIKLYSIKSDTITLTYFTNVQMSVYYLFIFCNSFLLKSIGLLRFSIFLK